MHVLDLDGHKEASDVLKEARLSLEKVQDKTATSFKLTKGLYFYTEGEIYCKTNDFQESAPEFKRVFELHRRVA